MKINKIEDIYPLTIISMRHGKFAIVNTNCDADCVNSLEDNEEWQYDPHGYMSREWSHIEYGVGETINEAFENFKNK